MCAGPAGVHVAAAARRPGLLVGIQFLGVPFHGLRDVQPAHMTSVWWKIKKTNWVQDNGIAGPEEEEGGRGRSILECHWLKSAGEEAPLRRGRKNEETR